MNMDIKKTVLDVTHMLNREYTSNKCEVFEKTNIKI